MTISPELLRSGRFTWHAPKWFHVFKIGRNRKEYLNNNCIHLAIISPKLPRSGRFTWHAPELFFASKKYSQLVETGKSIWTIPVFILWPFHLSYLGSTDSPSMHPNYFLSSKNIQNWQKCGKMLKSCNHFTQATPVWQIHMSCIRIILCSKKYSKFMEMSPGFVCQSHNIPLIIWPLSLSCQAPAKLVQNIHIACTQINFCLQKMSMYHYVISWTYLPYVDHPSASLAYKNSSWVCYFLFLIHPSHTRIWTSFRLSCWRLCHSDNLLGDT